MALEGMAIPGLELARLAGLAYVVGRRGCRARLDAPADRRACRSRCGVVLAVAGARHRRHSSRGRATTRAERAAGRPPAPTRARAGRRCSRHRRGGAPARGALRAARLSGLYWLDGWSFWVPKAKAIYYFGELDEEFFTELPGPSYPPLVPVLDAAAFHVWGALTWSRCIAQYWLFACRVRLGAGGLLAERVPAWILWPFVLLLLVAPRIGRRFHDHRGGSVPRLPLRARGACSWASGSSIVSAGGSSSRRC